MSESIPTNPTTKRLEVVDYTRVSHNLYVVVEERRSGTRIECSGDIGIDGTVEPLSPARYRPENDVLADQACEIAEDFVDEQTPFTMYDGDHWWYTKDLRGIPFRDRQEFSRLDSEELSELAARLRRGDITLGENDD